MLGLLMLVPIVITFIAWVFFKKRLHWQELLGTILLTYTFLLITWFIVKPSTTDYEYNGHLITKVEYYEYYETYVKKTCSRTVTRGTGKNKTTHTEYYDCSYCDTNPERFVLVSKEGERFSTDRKTYERLVKQWKSKPKFVDLKRSINKSFSCGKDGDMYYITWNKDVLTHESYTETISFNNPLMYKKTLFNGVNLDSLSLTKVHDYPIVINGKQNTIIGLENITIPKRDEFNRRINYFNSLNGNKHKLRYYTIFFKDSDINVAKLQESFLLGGNRNEVIICVGHDGKKIKWVYPFGWCENKVNLVNIREDLMKDDSIYVNKFLMAYERSKLDFKPRNFKDFDYIDYSPTKNDILILFSVMLFFNIISLVFFIFNQIHEDTEDGFLKNKYKNRR